MGLRVGAEETPEGIEIKEVNLVVGRERQVEGRGLKDLGARDVSEKG